MDGQGFVAAGKLHVGNSVVTRAGPALVVQNVTFVPPKQGTRVYNLTVADTHTYFGGNTHGGVWVHNVDCDFSSANLAHEYSKHADAFGVTGNWNNANRDLFKAAINAHINSAPQVIAGTFRGTVNVTHYYNPATRLWAAIDATGKFVAGWKLSDAQAGYLTSVGNVQ